MKKRIFSILTALALCLTLLPATAWAIDYPSSPYTEATIGSTTLASGNYYLIGDNGQLSTESASASNYNIYYSTDTETGAHSLTLNNANLKFPIYVLGNTTVTLVGENVGGSEGSKVSIGIQGMTPGSITIQGDGSYTAYSTHEGIATVQKDGEDALSDILIQGGTISLPGSSIHTRYGGITITGGASVEAEKISTGGNPNSEEAQRAREIVITGTDTKVKTEQISCLTTITVSGSAGVTVKNTSGIAMSAQNGIKILENASVEATGKTGALNSFGGSIVIEGIAEVTLTGQPINSTGNAAVSVGAGANSTGSITVKGNLTVTSKFAGIWTVGTGDITIDGGEVSVNAPYGILTRMGTSADATGGNVTIKNSGKLTINGAMGTYPQASNCTLTVDNSTVNTTTSSWGLYWPGSIVLKDSTVTCANTGNQNKAIGTATGIDYQYTDSYKVSVGASADEAKLVPHADLTAATYQNNYVKIESASSAQEAPADAPQLASSTTNSITLKEITANENGAAAEYGISEDGGETWKWQDSPAFTNLTSGTEYTFAVRYGATEDGNYVASPASETAKFSTDKPSVVVPVIPTYPPAVEDSDNGSVSVTPANPKQGSTVTVTPNPDKGYEVAGVTVTDSKGNPVAVTDNGDGTYSFTQPAGRVTVSVSFSMIVKELPFTDVSADDYFFDAVVWAVENGVTYGNTATTFGVGVTCNRADAVTFIWRAYGCPAPKSSENPFTDVADSAYYADAVLWAVENGITVGTSATTFRPLESCRREHIVTFLYRAAGSPTVSHSSGFSDVADSAYYANAVTWAAENGITVGAGSANTFGPTQDCFREQIATFLYRNLAE